jgi:hypothetical protein
MLTGACIWAGKAAVHLGTALLDIRDTKRTSNPEIAFVHELRQRFGKGEKQTANKAIDSDEE